MRLFVCVCSPTLVFQWCNDGNRVECGYGPVSTHLPLAESIVVRKGALPHFDLRIKACSSVGTALTDALQIQQLSDEAGVTARHDLLNKEIKSQVELPLLSSISALSPPPP